MGLLVPGRCWEGRWAGERGTYLHTDVAPGAVVGPGWAVEAALMAPLQAEGPVVHPYHMYHRGALFIGAWHGKGIEQQQEALPSVCCSRRVWARSPTASLGSKKGGDKVGRGILSPH